MKKFIYKIFLSLNILLGLSLLLSYLAKFINPSWMFPIALLGLAYPYVLLIFGALSVLLLLFKKYKWLVLNLLIIFIGWNDVSKHIQFNVNQQDEYDLRVMSYNVKLFDLYNWKENKIQKHKILSEISAYQPDIVCFQEFYFDNQEFPIDSVAIALKMPYYYVADNAVVLGFQHFGQAIFSKYPIKNKELIRYPETTNMSIFCDVQINPKQTVRVYSNHMESYRFSNSNLGLMKDLKQAKEPQIEQVKSIYEHLYKGMVKRAYQAEKISAHLNSSQYPVIITGDFNDTPNSFVYQTISDGLKDAFVEAGLGIGKTYDSDFIHLRIDYILYQTPFKCVNYQRLDLDISDHYPIIADFVIEP